MADSSRSSSPASAPSGRRGRSRAQSRLTYRRTFSKLALQASARRLSSSRLPAEAIYRAARLRRAAFWAKRCFTSSVWARRASASSVWYRLTTCSSAPGASGSRTWGAVASTIAARLSRKMTPSRLSGSLAQWMRWMGSPFCSALRASRFIRVDLPQPGPLLMRYICIPGSRRRGSKYPLNPAGVVVPKKKSIELLRTALIS